MNKYMQALHNRNFVRECEECFDITEPMELHYPDNCIRWLQSTCAHATIMKTRRNQVRWNGVKYYSSAQSSSWFSIYRKGAYVRHLEHVTQIRNQEHVEDSYKHSTASKNNSPMLWTVVNFPKVHMFTYR